MPRTPGREPGLPHCRLGGSLSSLTCGCRKADGCALRQYSTEYGSQPYRFLGSRRRFDQDTSHPDIIYEPGKCIMCDACVRIAGGAGESLGLSTIGRGFDVSVAVPSASRWPRVYAKSGSAVPGPVPPERSRCARHARAIPPLRAS